MSNDPDATKPLVSAAVVAQRLGCTARYVLMMAEQGKITAYRLGRKCVRFDLNLALEELGVTKKGGVR